MMVSFDFVMFFYIVEYGQTANKFLLDLYYVLCKSIFDRR